MYSVIVLYACTKLYICSLYICVQKRPYELFDSHTFAMLVVSKNLAGYHSVSLSSSSNEDYKFLKSTLHLLCWTQHLLQNI